MIEKLRSRVHLNIKGKNINRFIKKLRSHKIDILNIKYKDKNEASIIIYKKDYEKLLKIKSIYDITNLGVFGFFKIKKEILKNRHILFFIIICFILFIILTNVIFNVEIIHSNRDIRNLLNRELKRYGIKRLSFKKSYDSLSKIKEKILNKYPDKIQWLEIEEFGTKYIVRTEERKITNEKEDETPRNIIAKKPGMIKKVIAKKGDIVKDMDDYVEKGELIISGDLIFNDEIKGKVRADGKVYAEIWYTTKTNYPLIIDKKKVTKNKKTVFALKFLNKTIELSFNKYKYKKVKEKAILKSSILPISLIRQSQNEIEVSNEILTYDEALERAKNESIKEIKKGLNKDEYIIRSTYLKSRENNSTIEVEMFFAVYEDITDYQEIGD